MTDRQTDDNDAEDDYTA